MSKWTHAFVWPGKDTIRPYPWQWACHGKKDDDMKMNHAFSEIQVIGNGNDPLYSAMLDF